jgi:hypothetical protein
MKLKSDNTTQPTCENCSKELFGRIDKRFCNDNCRNEFNRKKKQQEIQKEHDNLPEILKIIKNNYNILKSYGPLEDPRSFIEVERSELVRKGFNFKFFTSTSKSHTEELKFCFERGWTESGYHLIIIREDLHQIKIT